MLRTPASSPNPTAEDRETRIQALVERLRPAAEQALPQLAETRVDVPDQELLGTAEHHLRDLAHDLAATAHQTGLASRNKGGTAAPPPPARTASSPPRS